MNSTTTTQPTLRGSRAVAWVKRLGVAGFMFFFIKGLLWLVIPAVIAWRAAG